MVVLHFVQVACLLFIKQVTSATSPVVVVHGNAEDCFESANDGLGVFADPSVPNTL